MHPTPAALPPEDRPRALRFFATSSALDYLPANACDRRAANDGRQLDEDTRALLDRAHKLASPARFEALGASA